MRMMRNVAVLGLLTASLMQTALAAEYSSQEKANMQLVRDFYAALDAAGAKGNMSEAIVGIAEKYIAPDYKQHAFGGKSGRENFVKMFQSMGAPPAGAPPAGAPARLPMEPAKLIALMADGDRVVQITSRGPAMIWNMFIVKNGKLAEHWDAGVTPPAAGGAPPPGAPPKK